MTYNLTDLDIEEVSLVDKPAIRKKFLIIKNDSTGEQMATETTKEADEDRKNKLRDMFTQMGKLLGFTEKEDETLDETNEEDEEEVMSEQEVKDENTEIDDTEKSEKEEKMEKSEAVTLSKADLDELKKSVMEDVSKAYEAKLEKAEKEVEALKTEASMRKAKDYVTDNEWIGDVETNAELYVKMSKSLDEEDFNSWLERENANSAQFAKAELFGEIGTHLSKSDDDSIEAKVAKSLREGKSYEDMLKDLESPEGRQEYGKYQKAVEKATNRKLHNYE